MNSDIATLSTKNKQLIPAACIVAGGLIIGAVILKTNVLANLFFVPPGPGYQQVASQFKTQMEAGIKKGHVFGKTHRWDGVKIEGVSFERNSQSYRVRYAVLLHNIKENKDQQWESDCPLSTAGAQGYIGSCQRPYSPQKEEAGSTVAVTVR